MSKSTLRVVEHTENGETNCETSEGSVHARFFFLRTLYLYENHCNQWRHERRQVMQQDRTADGGQEVGGAIRLPIFIDIDERHAF